VHDCNWIGSNRTQRLSQKGQTAGSLRASESHVFLSLNPLLLTQSLEKHDSLQWRKGGNAGDGVSEQCCVHAAAQDESQREQGFVATPNFMLQTAIRKRNSNKASTSGTKQIQQGSVFKQARFCIRNVL
jgi:hypothetical protein